MRKTICLLQILVVISAVFWGCASFRETERPKPPEAEKRAPFYTWSNFFNNGCGSSIEIELNSEDEATLAYPCSSGKLITQHARRHKRLNEVELWAASELPEEKLYQLSNSKCRASIIYLGVQRVTIKFPCALIHMTVTYDIASREKNNNAIRIHLNPVKALITYGDGVQEFDVKDERLTPLGPFKPFKIQRPSIPMTQKRINRSPFLVFKNKSF